MIPAIRLELKRHILCLLEFDVVGIRAIHKSTDQSLSSPTVMDAKYKPISAHTYKTIEAEIRSIILPKRLDPLTITAKDIRNALSIKRKRSATPMREKTDDNEEPR